MRRRRPGASPRKARAARSERGEAASCPRRRRTGPRPSAHGEPSRARSLNGDTRRVKVLAIRPLPGPAWTELRDVSIGSLDEPQADVEVLIVANETVDGELLDLLPALRLVANLGVGSDPIDPA